MINVKKHLVKYIYKFLVVGIIGNKYDLIEEEQVKQQEVEKFAQEINGIYGFTSAKDGTGIKDIIEKGFEMFVEKHSDTNKSKDKNNQKNLTFIDKVKFKIFLMNPSFFTLK